MLLKKPGRALKWFAVRGLIMKWIARIFIFLIILGIILILASKGYL
jgi:hypothetical protein